LKAAESGNDGRPPVQVFVPVRDATPEFDLCLLSLAYHLPPNCSVWILDCGLPANGVKGACDAFENSNVQLTYVRRENCPGFAEICNWALTNLWVPGQDSLLLSPSARVTAGFLDEMRRVLHLHERHAVVSPRTNGSAFLSLTPDGDLTPTECYDLWARIHRLLPRYHLVPAVAGFCLLIKSEALERFGPFDIAGCPDVQNEFIRRINRFGFSALAANWAYVFNTERSVGWPANNELDAVPPASLAERYPEFDRKTSDYSRFQIDPIETFAILYSPHRPRILYDLYHLLPQHSGTSNFALNLLREIAPLASKEFDFYVGVGKDQGFFLTDLSGYRLYDEESSLPMVFDLVYKPCQIFRWHEFARMNRLAPRVAFTLLDIIALRCDYIGNATLPPLFQRTVELSDLVITISEFSRSDFAAFYSTDTPMPVIYLASHAHLVVGENAPGEHILIMGNSLVHKGVSQALRCLGADLPIVVVGGERKSDQSNLRWLASGQLSQRLIHDLFTRAKVLVYPSYYEGYGLPVADALAFGKPVIVLDTAVNREMALNTGDPNLHLVRSLNELLSTVQKVWQEPHHSSHSLPRRWPQVATEYLAAFRTLLSKDIDPAKMRRRWDTIRLLESLDLG
jgi:glycosyltransferase involved in cell wall biosynthesis